MALPPFRRIVLLLAIAVAARAITFGNPIVHVDEEFYFLAASAMIDGAVPYVDLWDRKPIGLFLLYLPAAALGYPLGIWAYQAMALAAVVATALVIARLVERAGWRAGAAPAAVAYILFLNFADGQGGQAPVFYNLPMALAALLIAPSPTDGDARARWRRGLMAMALVGVALQIKYTAVFEGAFFGLWWVWREWRVERNLRRTVVRAAPLVLAVCVPTLAAWGWYAAHGQQAAFVFANFTSILNRRPDPWSDRLRNLAWLAAILVPLIVVAARSRRDTDVGIFVGAWLAVSVIGVLVFGSWFNHYALPVLLPAAACAAGWLGAHRRTSLALLCIAFVTGQAMLVKKRLKRGDPAQFAALTEAIGRRPESLFVASGTPMLYAATARPRLSPYVFPSHLQFRRETGAIGIDQAAETRRILAARPGIIVTTSVHRGERPEIRALVDRYIAAHYRRTADLPLGRSRVAVHVRSIP